MTLFGLLWAALLPHHPVNVNSSTPPARLGASSYSATSAQTQDTVALRPYSYSPLHLQAKAYQPPRLRPQFFWPPQDAVDWRRWSATAAVAVVAQPNATPRASGFTDLRPHPGFCGSNSPNTHGKPTPTPGRFTIQVKQVTIGQMPSRQVADAMAAQLRQAMPLLEASPNDLTPSLSPTLAAGQVHGKTVFVLPDLAPDTDGSDRGQAAIQATQWVNNLRLAFGATPLDSSHVQMVAYGLGETRHSFSGTASWYGPYFHGRQTATGETFDQHDLTAAHKTLPFGTYLKVRNQLNGRTVVVRINDRGPYVGERSLDLSYAAAQCLGSDLAGVIPYQATILAPGFPHAWREEGVAALP